MPEHDRLVRAELAAPDEIDEPRHGAPGVHRIEDDPFVAGRELDRLALRLPQHRVAAAATTSSPACSRGCSPAKTILAPSRWSRSRLPVATVGAWPRKTITHRSPHAAAAAAVCRAWFDCTAPSVTSVSASRRSASATL